ncbi:hypothetical protein LOTGIDRAFT_164079 [Lottia gigantea]|uniref:Uncharacterized protein n=1 Tax=Lottia gigantea TaxID=225164 RepID=V4A1G6_LOTGI|nr:hypothetical protein LOTGIDRAFT_164079 [Lottia gigantea]ESO90497.1 hypothetical protein LOTGIDRAFT_164079 [Lottia gigantea]
MIIAHAPKTYFGSGDIQKSLGSLSGFPWVKYPGEKHLPGHNRLDLRLDENDKPKPGEEPVNRVDAAALKHDILYRKKDINFRHEADRQMIIELENIPNPTFKKRMQRALIIKLLKAKMKLGMGLADEIHKEFRKTRNFLKVKSPENDNDAVHKKYLREQINSIEVNKNHLEDKISNVKRFFKRLLNNNNFVNDTKLQQEVKVESIFFRQNFSLYKKFNAQKILQFINGTKNVEIKEFEINDENSKPRHLYEIKTSGKYIDRFRMLIIPDKEEDEFTLSHFDMLLETETPPSTSIIRNPEPQKEGNMSYEFLRTSDFEYVKLYFVHSDIFTSIDIHKSQQKKKILIPTIRDDVDAYVNISISIEKPKFSPPLNKINDSKEQMSLISVEVFIDDGKQETALSEIHLI